MKAKWICDGTAIYALNANGHNAFLLTVGRGCMCDKCGPYDDEKRAENLALARTIFAAPEMADFINRVAFEPIGPSDASNREILETLTAEARAMLARIEKETT